MDVRAKHVDDMLKSTRVLVVEDEHYCRKVIRTLLLAIGISDIHDASDGSAGLAVIPTIVPNVVLLDWEMPDVDGPEFVRRVRQPSEFPYPNLPIIMLTGHAERRRVVEAVRLGVNEYLLKPVSSSSLRARLVSVLAKPRDVVRMGEYYGPMPRKLSFTKPQVEPPKPPRTGGIVFVN